MEDTTIMKRIMSVGGLQRYCRDKRLGNIIFCSDNQSLCTVTNPLKFQLTFTSMTTASNPNVVCLKGGDSVLWLERVKNVVVDEAASPLGTILDVICGDRENDSNDIHYIFVAT